MAFDTNRPADSAEGGQQQDEQKRSKRSARNRRSKRNNENRRRADSGNQDKSPTGAKQPRDQQTRQVYSAIDLGTNNCRLLIAKPTKNGFRVIDAFSRIVRLGEGVAQSGMLSDAAMDRTIEALKVCGEKIGRRGVTCMNHVATEACRVAGNSEEFVERVRLETGINLNVISTAEEARLAVAGCQSLIAPGNRHALVFDIGGGSTELIWVSVSNRGNTNIIGWTSIPWGVVNLTETYAEGGEHFVGNQYELMTAEVKKHLHPFEDRYAVSEVVDRSKVQFLGTSGTVTTLASLHLKLPRYDRNKVDGAWMKSSQIHHLSREVAAMTHAERCAQPCIGEDRADLVVAGCAILDAILGMWDVNSLRVADRGIREGILREMMQIENRPQGRRRPKRSRNRSQGQNTNTKASNEPRGDS